MGFLNRDASMRGNGLRVDPLPGDKEDTSDVEEFASQPPEEDGSDVEDVSAGHLGEVSEEEEEEGGGENDSDFLDPAGTPPRSDSDVPPVDYEAVEADVTRDFQQALPGAAKKKKKKNPPAAAATKNPPAAAKEQEPRTVVDEVPEWFRELMRWMIYQCFNEPYPSAKKIGKESREEFNEMNRRIRARYGPDTRFGRYWKVLVLQTHENMRVTPVAPPFAGLVCDLDGTPLKSGAVTVTLYSAKDEARGVSFNVNARYRQLLQLLFKFRYPMRDMMVRAKRELARHHITECGAETLAPLLSYDRNRQYYADAWAFHRKLYGYVEGTLGV